MHTRFGSIVLPSALLVACGGSEPAAAVPQPPPLLEAGAAAEVSPSDAGIARTEPAPPSPEEKKKADEQAKLADARAKWKHQNEAELARWTPELHAAAKALAAKPYPTFHAALLATTAGKHRKPGNADRDKSRHPIETLELFGLKPTHTVLEIDPGDGWYTELLAPALAAKGKLIDTIAAPTGAHGDQAAFGAERFHAFLDKAPELYGKVETVVVDSSAPKLELDGKVDAVLLMRVVHALVGGEGNLDTWLAEIRRALKPGGVLGIEDHRAKPDAIPLESAKLGYLPEKWVIARVEAAGFKLVGRSEVNANPKDTKDYSIGVWALPPTLRLGDQDRDKYLAIGESDRMTLKFVRAPDPAAGPKK
jgi:predicted methyltransferase